MMIGDVKYLSAGGTASSLWQINTKSSNFSTKSPPMRIGTVESIMSYGSEVFLAHIIVRKVPSYRGFLAKVL